MWCYKELGTFDLGPLVEMVDNVPWKAEYRNPYSVACLRVHTAALSEEYKKLIRSYSDRYGKMIRCDIRKVPPNGEITPHTDPNVEEGERRLHWPILSHPNIKMIWPKADDELYMEPGHLYEVNPHQLHQVLNPTKVDRVHLMVDVKLTDRH